ncbi:hypothetical protein JK386_04295 [Nocardioides sp. zg-536]|uniref:Uncharacterized protein n=1 Tax=Nocardioides faecalis TaxID=2803858 RepID=A0A938Y7V9_9ACTN|nr:hypothetical protein [Nocardioides faecalis]MBM9459111.1 hypothetical protein [Nocardioides faecalis]QVI57368.1 hypothetical protein KG111_09555 [Nocardioides faecalis]
MALTTDLGLAPWRLVAWLGEHGGPLHALLAGWLLLAPAPLLLAALLRPRTPWPWAGLVALHLLAVTVVLARFPHLVPAEVWPVLGAAVVVALASVVSCFGGARPGSAP